MVNQPRSAEPRYSCIVPVDSLTGNLDEELMVFGESAAAALNQAEQLLLSQYGCDRITAQTLLQQASLELLAHWCTPSHSPDSFQA